VFYAFNFAMTIQSPGTAVSMEVCSFSSIDGKASLNLKGSILSLSGSALIFRAHRLVKFIYLSGHFDLNNNQKMMIAHA
jgi:hypothetical protein